MMLIGLANQTVNRFFNPNQFIARINGHCYNGINCGVDMNVRQ
jgi:hypothetical protein